MSDEPQFRSRGVAPPNDAMSAVQVAFPQTVEDFESDERVAFDKLANKWILEEDDGQEWEWNDAVQRWMPSLDEAAIAQQREAYKVEGVDEEETTVDIQKKKRKVYAEEGIEEVGGREKKKSRKTEKDEPERKNSAVYVTSLPLDVTVDEVYSLFSKYGLIAESDADVPRIKLYTDEDGKFKGEALVVYFRPESVNLAVQMLDDTDFRLGQEGPAGKMRVKEAEASYKKQKDEPTQTKTKLNAREKKKMIQRMQKLNNKLADWDDDDPSVMPSTSSRFDKVVILKHMFTLQELEEDPAATLDIKEDIRDECSKLGDVTNVVLFDKEPEGVASVRFSNAEAAKACVRLMDGRWFGGTQVEAFVSTGAEKFKKTKENKVAFSAEEDGDEEKRLDEFGKFLEQDGHPGSETTATS